MQPPLIPRINRAPVLTLWAAVVAERLGMPREAALTVGQALADLAAYAKGVRLGIRLVFDLTDNVRGRQTVI